MPRQQSTRTPAKSLRSSSTLTEMPDSSEWKSAVSEMFNGPMSTPSPFKNRVLTRRSTMYVRNVKAKSVLSPLFKEPALKSNRRKHAPQKVVASRSSSAFESREVSSSLLSRSSVVVSEVKDVGKRKTAKKSISPVGKKSVMQVKSFYSSGDASKKSAVTSPKTRRSFNQNDSGAKYITSSKLPITEVASSEAEESRQNRRSKSSSKVAATKKRQVSPKEKSLPGKKSSAVENIGVELDISVQEPQNEKVGDKGSSKKRPRSQSPVSKAKSPKRSQSPISKAKSPKRSLSPASKDKSPQRKTRGRASNIDVVAESISTSHVITPAVKKVSKSTPTVVKIISPKASSGKKMKSPLTSKKLGHSPRLVVRKTPFKTPVGVRHSPKPKSREKSPVKSTRKVQILPKEAENDGSLLLQKNHTPNLKSAKKVKSTPKLVATTPMLSSVIKAVSTPDLYSTPQVTTPKAILDLSTHRTKSFSEVTATRKSMMTSIKATHENSSNKTNTKISGTPKGSVRSTPNANNTPIIKEKSTKKQIANKTPSRMSKSTPDVSSGKKVISTKSLQDLGSPLKNILKSKTPANINNRTKEGRSPRKTVRIAAILSAEKSPIVRQLTPGRIKATKSKTSSRLIENISTSSRSDSNLTTTTPIKAARILGKIPDVKSNRKGTPKAVSTPPHTSTPAGDSLKKRKAVVPPPVSEIRQSKRTRKAVEDSTLFTGVNTTTKTLTSTTVNTLEAGFVKTISVTNEDGQEESIVELKVEEQKWSLWSYCSIM